MTVVYVFAVVSEVVYIFAAVSEVVYIFAVVSRTETIPSSHMLGRHYFQETTRK